MNATEKLLSLTPDERLALLTALLADEPVQGRIVVSVQRIVRRPAGRPATATSAEVAA